MAAFGFACIYALDAIHIHTILCILYYTIIILYYIILYYTTL